MNTVGRSAIRTTVLFLLLIIIFSPMCSLATVENDDAIRIYGQTAYDTSYALARYEMSHYGKAKTVIVATGENYPDAISAGCLSLMKNAPIILVNEKHEQETLSVIKEVAEHDALIYIIGGPLAISNRFQDSISKAGFPVKRLGGQNMYDTNLLVLEEVNTIALTRPLSSRNIYVATGKNYRDALVASVTGGPVLLVRDSLTPMQKSYLRKFNGNAVIVGGSSAVSDRVASEVRLLSKSLRRVGGQDAYETSYLFSTKFYQVKKDSVVIASGETFQDAASGIYLAGKLNAPILLTSDKNYAESHNYIYRDDVKHTYILGGPKAISNETKAQILNNNLGIIKPNRKSPVSQYIPPWARKSTQESKTFSYGDYGHISVPVAEISVPVNKANHIGSSQSLVDKNNSSVIIQGDVYGYSNLILDHSGQGFFGLERVSYGDTATLKLKTGETKKYVCVGMWTVRNKITELVLDNGMRIFPEAYYDLILGTCQTGDGKYDVIRGFLEVRR